MLEHLIDIAGSWYRAHIHTPEQKVLADERLAVCFVCPESGRNEYTNAFVCFACNCPLQSKVYSLRGPNACPKGKWSQ